MLLSRAMNSCWPESSNRFLLTKLKQKLNFNLSCKLPSDVVLTYLCNHISSYPSLSPYLTLLSQLIVLTLLSSTLHLHLFICFSPTSPSKVSLQTSHHITLFYFLSMHLQLIFSCSLVYVVSPSVRIPILVKQLTLFCWVMQSCYLQNYLFHEWMNIPSD